ncbi:hypothetical protein CPB84DRAFT_1775664 [Gymnopilus junonius]|uniref:F-box domain-containing protein n=1 Tax=Gymnopilus junonius TaxID=109634 RepID=A0A9P5NMR8_GYMJU|nr:hypothetical protein CPB84DRAFT_1775664 [Gymnopilus junonius]
MVSADNLNLDVLELIFAFLFGNDLPSVALVSRSFLAAVIPRLYSSISYRLRQAKGYDVGETISPFAAVVTHPHLAVHVRKIQILAVPTVKSPIHSVFVRECREAIRICTNLRIFNCVVPNVLSMLLPGLQEKERLERIRICANLTLEQTKLLVKVRNLQHLSLEFASWNVVDLLPSWTMSLSSTLTSLTLYMIYDLHEDIFGSILDNLPNLIGLHVVGCPKVDHVIVFRHLSKTPLLQNLSLTTSENTRALALPPPLLRDLKHIAFDVRYSMSPSPSPTILASILDHLKPSSPSLVHFVIKMPERKVLVGEPFINKLLESSKHSLRRLAFLDCGVSPESLINICKSCIHLERLDIAIPVKEMPSFIHNISDARTLRTLVDVDNHVEHGIRPSLGSDNVMHLMRHNPSLKEVITTHRVWTRIVDRKDQLIVTLDRRHPPSPGSFWFMPRKTNFQ